MDEVIDLLLQGILSGGHCLLMGVPGLAKTLLLSTLSELLELKFSRIQFTPDLMPSDIVGTEVIAQDQQTLERDFRFMSGPIFSNIVLADEINRTPPKTQAALMEAMEEHQVTVGGRTHKLEAPFFVLATQNPIEQEGTYPLPAAQLDRFAFLIHVEYPTRGEEYQIIRRTTTSKPIPLKPVLRGPDILEIMDFLKREPAPASVVAFATEAARATRPKEAAKDSRVAKYLAWGVGPRGAQAVVMAAKVRAILKGRRHATTEDVAALAPFAFRHRMILNFRGAAEGVTTLDLLQEILTQPMAR
jgi:MoxR-like ATPase